MGIVERDRQNFGERVEQAVEFDNGPFKASGHLSECGKEEVAERNAIEVVKAGADHAMLKQVLEDGLGLRQGDDRVPDVSGSRDVECPRTTPVERPESITEITPVWNRVY